MTCTYIASLISDHASVVIIKFFVLKISNDDLDVIAFSSTNRASATATGVRVMLKMKHAGCFINFEVSFDPWIGENVCVCERERERDLKYNTMAPLILFGSSTYSLEKTIFNFLFKLS